MVSQVAGNGADTVMIMCTNVCGAPGARVWEDKYGIRVFDSVATVIQGMFEALAIIPEGLEQWGSVFTSR